MDEIGGEGGEEGGGGATVEGVQRTVTSRLRGEGQEG